MERGFVLVLKSYGLGVFKIFFSIPKLKKKKNCTNTKKYFTILYIFRFGRQNPIFWMRSIEELCGRVG